MQTRTVSYLAPPWAGASTTPHFCFRIALSHPQESRTFTTACLVTFPARLSGVNRKRQSPQRRWGSRFTRGLMEERRGLNFLCARLGLLGEPLHGALRGEARPLRDRGGLTGVSSPSSSTHTDDAPLVMLDPVVACRIFKSANWSAASSLMPVVELSL